MLEYFENDQINLNSIISELNKYNTQLENRFYTSSNSPIGLYSQITRGEGRSVITAEVKNDT